MESTTNFIRTSIHTAVEQHSDRFDIFHVFVNFSSAQVIGVEVDRDITFAHVRRRRRSASLGRLFFSPDFFLGGETGGRISFECTEMTFQISGNVECKLKLKMYFINLKVFCFFGPHKLFFTPPVLPSILFNVNNFSKTVIYRDTTVVKM